MKKPYRLYWSNLDLYEQCPQKFLWYKGWGVIDVGGGPGRRKPLELGAPRSEHHALMGIVIASAVEKIYNDEWWRQPKELKSRLTDFIEEEFHLQIARSYINWNETSKSELKETCKSGVVGYLKIMKHNRLLGDLYSKAEVILKADVDGGIPIGGRPDVIINRSDSGLLIIDGKNSKTPGRYVSKDQLRWYALIYYLINQSLADLAFAYFRYPPDNPPESHLKKKRPSEWTGLVYVPVSVDQIHGLIDRAKLAYSGMAAERFEATPSSKACRFCEYQDVCVSYQEGQMKKSNPEYSGKGFIDFSFDA